MYLIFLHESVAIDLLDSTRDTSTTQGKELDDVDNRTLFGIFLRLGSQQPQGVSGKMIDMAVVQKCLRIYYFTLLLAPARAYVKEPYVTARILSLANISVFYLVCRYRGKSRFPLYFDKTKDQKPRLLTP